MRDSCKHTAKVSLSAHQLALMHSDHPVPEFSQIKPCLALSASMSWNRAHGVFSTRTCLESDFDFVRINSQPAGIAATRSASEAPPWQRSPPFFHRSILSTVRLSVPRCKVLLCSNSVQRVRREEPVDNHSQGAIRSLRPSGGCSPDLKSQGCNMRSTSSGFMKPCNSPCFAQLAAFFIELRTE
jgi:hypothetical protein